MEPLIFWSATRRKGRWHGSGLFRYEIAWRSLRSTVRSRANALILMGDWCGGNPTDTSKRNTGRGNG